MHNITRRSLALAALLLGFAAPAAAARAQASSYLAATERIASATFPASPCAGRVVLMLRSDTKIARLAAAADVAPAGGGSLIGLSFPHDGSCRIILDRNLRNVPA